MTHAQLWKDMCRLLEDKRDGNGFEDYRRSLNTFAVFELDDGQGKNLQTQVQDGDQVEISPFPFPRMSIVTDGIVVCVHEPLMNPQTSEFSFEMFMYQDGFKFLEHSGAFDRFLLRARVFVHPENYVAGFEECSSLTFGKNSKLFYSNGQTRYERGPDYESPIRSKKNNEHADLTAAERKARVKEIEDRLTELRAQRKKTLLETKDLEVRYAEAVQDTTDMWFKYALTCIRWITHPDHFTVHVNEPGKPRRSKGERIPRLGEQDHYIVMEKHEIAEAWKRANHGGTHASPVPHLRRGHYKHLQAERYKEKRGKLVWVRATHVNGKCVEWRNGNTIYRVI